MSEFKVGDKVRVSFEGEVVRLTYYDYDEEDYFLAIKCNNDDEQLVDKELCKKIEDELPESYKVDINKRLFELEKKVDSNNEDTCCSINDMVSELSKRMDELEKEKVDELELTVKSIDENNQDDFNDLTKKINALSNKLSLREDTIIESCLEINILKKRLHELQGEIRYGIIPILDKLDDKID